MNNKTRITILLSAATMAFATLASAKEWATIRIGVDPTYPPFESTATDGSVQGFDVDLGNALCAKLNAKCVGVEQLRRTDSGPAGAQVRRDPVVDGRDRTAPPADRLHRPPVPQPDAPDRLHRRRAAARRGEARRQAHRGRTGTIQETYAREKWAPAKVEVVPYPSYDQAYADLVTGRIDGVLMDAVQGQLGFLATPRGKGFSFAGGVVFDPRIMGNGDAIGVRKADTDLRDALNRAIAQIRSDGTYRKIESKYFDFDMYGN
jgi:ABC-type amino acid transport substrate-binding protein